jgi:hypothetical protein
VSSPLIANVLSFINISNIFKQLRHIYLMTFRVANWNTLDDSLAFLVCKGKIFLSAQVPCLHFNMQEEDILEHSNRQVNLMAGPRGPA